MSLRITVFADQTKANEERNVAVLQFGADQVRLVKAAWLEVTDTRQVPPHIAYTAEADTLWILEVEM